jgi:hypothetical protein
MEERREPGEVVMGPIRVKALVIRLVAIDERPVKCAKRNKLVFCWLRLRESRVGLKLKLR